MVKLGKYSGIISLLRDARGVYVLVDYVPKKEKKEGKETTEETSEKSDELESKDQGAYMGGGIFVLRHKK